MRHTFGMFGAGLLLALSAVPAAAADDAFERMMKGQSNLQGKELEEAIKQAEAHPLGSAKNPVRTTKPQGQHLYLSRLRCSDGNAPKFYRAGNVGVGPFGNIVDLYKVSCGEAEPRESDVYMDMYHGGFIESRAVPGFAGGSVVPEPKAEPVPVKDPTG
jgi:hypothetical protein